VSKPSLHLRAAYVGALAEPLGLVMRRVVEPEVMRQVCLYRPSRRATSPAAQGFEEHLESWMRHWHRQRSGGAQAPRRTGR